MALFALLVFSSAFKNLGNIKMQNSFDSGTTGVFIVTIFTLAFSLIYIGSINLSKNSKGKLAAIISLVGGVLIVFYLFSSNYFPLADFTKALPHSRNANISTNLSMYEIPIELLNNNFILTSLTFLAGFA